MIAAALRPGSATRAGRPTRGGSPRPPTGSSTGWRRAAPPGSTGTSTPRPSARCAPHDVPADQSAIRGRPAVSEVLDSHVGRAHPPLGRDRRAGRAAPGRRRLGLHRRRRPTGSPQRRFLAAEQRLVAAAGRRDGRRVDEQASSWRCWSPPPTASALNAGQAALVREMATSGARLQLAHRARRLGQDHRDAGARPAWTDGGGTVIGLAPSAAAAAVSPSQIGTQTDTLAKLTWSLHATIGARLGRHRSTARRW